ncbi:hypothetical protein [Brachybacterium sp. UNK5269]|uniref:hypothetical protein n=1 Tax=Brachybacterium sp. UNK5269 TaxID=3408576 RepID=UPI003BAE3E37
MHTGKYNEVLHRHFSHIPTTSSKGVSAQDALELFLEASFSGPEDVLVFSTAHPFSTEGSLLVLDHERLAVLRYNFTGSDDAVFSFSGSVRPLSAVKGVAILPSSTAWRSSKTEPPKLRIAATVDIDGEGEVGIGYEQPHRLSVSGEEGADERMFAELLRRVTSSYRYADGAE